MFIKRREDTMRTTLLGMALLGLLAQPVFAAPSITSVVTNADGTATISGLGFGTKANAAPLIWENFEGNQFVPGLYLKDIDSSWVPGADKGAQVIACPGGGKCIRNHIYNTDDGTGVSIPHNKWATNMKAVPPSTELYYTYKLYLAYSGAKPYGIGKLGRIMTDVPGGSYSSTGTVGISSWQPLYNAGTGWLYIPTTTEQFKYFSVDALPIQKWFRQEIYGKKSTPGVADGAVYVSNNGTTIVDNKAAITCAAGYDFNYKAIYLPMSVANTETQLGTTDTVIDITVDDVYVDNTLARVELCDSPNWSSCSVKEVQIPSAWSSSQISFSFNQGSLPASAYLYVVDSTGAANSAGYKINIPSQVLAPANLRRTQ